MKQLSPFIFILILFSSCHLLEKASGSDSPKNKKHEGPCASVPCSESGAGELIELYEKEMKEEDLMIEKSFKVIAHIIEHPSRPSDLDETAIHAAIAELNQNFEGAHIQFNITGSISKSNSPYFLNDIRSSQLNEKIITDPLDVENTINIYLIQSNSLLAGYTPVLSDGFKDYAHLGLNKVFISHRAIKQPATVAHEFGHFFNLQHTFGNSPLEASTEERLDGSNCQHTGDFICDTPPDPNGQQDCCDCSYLGTTTPTSTEFNPLTNNFMSYYKYCCRTAFTPGQLKAIKMAALEYRAYLN